MPQELSNMHKSGTYHYGRSYMVTQFIWIPNYDWYMARLVLKNIHENETFCNENLTMGLKYKHYSIVNIDTIKRIYITLSS